ncbi:phospholipid/cholesterol/gamma-HCH transport system substrate-binding protein [Povalibacter uvarum]|uniref:Phospholipid/cholesterol/gamma-HCH transport system substrate-binding protein n=1 Tax=Povalibacter uvarum TaxID=732238 RepID=A0A841HJB7_9GAMM|nr:MlaD family protein [Povalibacter uvarum]MBB6092684.1 phospholipid/cholesterol/gamma-HCH transport system substrate-binding protein [Povalibacter uvarum]
MEREANYVAVGAFILLVIAMGVGFVLWYTDARDRKDYELYEIYFAGSVSGLERGGPVRYLGVDVGRVRRIDIDHDNPGRVVVVAEIDRAAPISSATRASLGLQGVTGLLYVNLKEVPDVNKSADLKQGHRYPVIESVASDFDTFIASLPELMSRANSLLERVGRVLSDENLDNLSQTMANLREASKGLPATARNIETLVAEVQATAVEIHAAAEGLRGITTDVRPEIKQAVEKIGVVADNLAQASARIDRLSRDSEVQLGHFANTGLFELERLVRETRSAAREFRDLSRSLQENPSQILYEPPVSGIEIAK